MARGSGVRSTKGLPGGVRASLRPATIGLASVLATGAVGQDAPPASEQQTPPVSAPVETGQPAPVPVPAEQVEQAPAGQAAEPAQTPEQAEEEAESLYTLPTVQVEAEAERYKVGEASLARLPSALVNTPQTVVVVPQEVLREQNATNLRDALRNVSGITVTAGEGGRQGDSFVIRGFSAQSDTYRDGVRDLGWFTRDMANLGGVETYFGPSAVLFGRGATGGAINLVTKKPTQRAFTDVRLSGGSAPSGRVELDVNQPVNDRVQVRISGAGQLAEVAGRNEVRENRLLLSPSARVKLTDSTSVEVDYLLQREDGVPDYGHPYFNGLPISTSGDVKRDVFYGVKNSDREQVTANIATARLLHTIREGSVLTNTLRFGRVDRLARPTAPRGLTPAEEPTTIGRQRFETETDNTYLVNQTDLRLGFLTAFLEHTVNVGMELSRENRDQTRFNLNAVGLPTGNNLPADLYNPDPLPDLSAVARVFSTATETEQTTVGLYAGDQVKIGRYVEVLGSLRFDWLQTDYRARAANGTVTPQHRADRMLNWRLGAVVHPIDNTSLYAMTGSSTNPSAELATFANGAVALDPERNQTYEVGAKADLLDGRLGLSGAVFQVDKLNARIPNTDPEGPPLVLEGEQQVRGLNVGIAGRILERWQLMLSYTAMTAQITRHLDENLIGDRLPNTPPHSASAWTTYDVLDGLSVGGGVTYASVTPASATVRVPSYWRVDAFVRYAFADADVQLNLNNLTNALYYEQYYGGHAVPAEAFNANLTLGMRF